MKGNSPDWPWLDQACLFTKSYWGHADFDPSEGGVLHHRGHGPLAHRKKEDSADNGYFFALPLFALRSEADLERRVVDPLKRLFASADPCAEAGAALTNVPVLLPATG